MSDTFERCVSRMRASRNVEEVDVAMMEAKKCISDHRERPALLDPAMEGAVSWLMEDLILWSKLKREQRARSTDEDSDRFKDGYAPGDRCRITGTSTENTDLCSSLASSPDDAGGRVVLREKCRILLDLVGVRGWKAVVRCMPHDAEQLEGAILLLAELERVHSTSGDGLRQLQNTSNGAAVDNRDMAPSPNLQRPKSKRQSMQNEGCEPVVSCTFGVSSPSRGTSYGFSQRGNESWVDEGEIKCAILLWLCVLIMMPFDVAVVDSAREDPGMESLEDLLLGLCKVYLSTPGNLRDVAALLVARLLTRRDMGLQLSRYCSWCRIQALESDLDVSCFLIPGIAHSLAYIFKWGNRTSLAHVVKDGLAVAEALHKSSNHKSSSLVRKLAHKLTQRVILSMLPVASASWKYDKRMTSLLIAGETKGFEPNQRQLHSQGILEDEFAVPENLEQSIEVLLSGLCDRDTIVRWSCAKGLGRISSRLPLELADDIIEAIVGMISPQENDSTWHGACLAIAELARRGLLLPVRLDDVVPKVVSALTFDIRRGPHSVGAHVRDAACYVCWAFARAYDPEIMAKPALQLAPALLVTACYDREVHCRRAASAAFQEAVGRQGASSFAHGIEIITAADYIAVGPRQRAYLEVAPFVAQFPEYTESLVDHLINVKLKHWECSLRILSSKGLRALCIHAKEKILCAVCSILIPLCTDVQLEVRHGAVYGIAECLLGLGPLNCLKDVDRGRMEAIECIVERIESARLFRGKGGELMRDAACRLILCISEVRLQVSVSCLHAFQRCIDESLGHSNQEIQSAASHALEKMMLAYFAEDMHMSKHLVSQYCEWLSNTNNLPRRRGGALALAALPACIFTESALAEITLGCLCQNSIIAEDPEGQDAETRVNCVRALGKIFERISRCASMPLTAISSELNQAVFSTLLAALEDYSVDDRGDVGSWVRESAIKSLEVFIAVNRKMEAAGMEVDLQENETLALGHFAKQAMERIDRLRGTAGCAVIELIRHESPTRLHAKHGKELQMLLANGTSWDSVNWSSPLESFPCLVKLIEYKAYRYQIVSGLVLSIGGICQNLSTIASQSLFAFMSLSSAPSWSEFVSTVLDVWRSACKKDRITVPLMKTLDTIYTNTSLRTLKDTGSSPHQEILQLAREEGRGCKDVKKLNVIANLLCHLCLTHEPVSSSTLSVYMALLGNRFPRVRKYAAEQLYVTLLMVDESVDEFTWAGSANHAMEVLSNSPWDCSPEVARAARDQVRAALSLGNTKG